MLLSTVTRRVLMVAALSLVAACGAQFRTDYAQPVDPAVSRGWRVAEVAVTVPQTLTVSEDRSLFPRADIVWREDPPGDRRAQVARILTDAARAGASGLRGPRPVVLRLTVERFHALTFEAETRLMNSGVHNITFVASVTDARTGEVLAGPDRIEASLPAFSGNEARRARAAGQTQKSVISAHVRRVIAGWLGTGEDPRGSFSRLGG